MDAWIVWGVVAAHAVVGIWLLRRDLKKHKRRSYGGDHV